MRDDKKISESAKQKTSTTTTADSNMDATKASGPEDVYEFKTVKESDTSPDSKSVENLEVDNEVTDTTPAATATAPGSQTEETTKRNFSEISESQDEGNNDDETRRKKRKEEGNKETKGTVAQRTSGQAKNQGGKQGSGTQAKTGISCSKSSKSY